MCVVSMVGDHYGQKFAPYIQPPVPTALPIYVPTPLGPPPVAPSVIVVPQAEYEALKRDVEEMKALLKRAKLYDEQNNEPECEQDDKMDLLRRVAAAVGVSLEDVIAQPKAGAP